ncbi:MAG: hypothetical protein DMF61_11255 [Blastocatellia bacterium AA13]|nr:MAG: hypothetical protein DMF61_11255 [Blastocatellia bacterium AA13]
MSFLQELRNGVKEVGSALREPEEVALRWYEQGREGVEPLSPMVFLLLTLTAILCTATYGVTMGMGQSGAAMLQKGFNAPIAAGLSWLITLPTLYILNSLLGSKLDLPTTTLAALITVSFGALAMLASVPINWFFTVAIGNRSFTLFINLIVFSGVGMSMSNVFIRVMKALEPQRTFPTLWLGLVTAIGSELFYLLGLFEF